MGLRVETNFSSPTAARHPLPFMGEGSETATVSEAVFTPAGGGETERGCAPARKEHPSLGEVWARLGEVVDPEIPVLSVVDLGIVRNLEWRDTDVGPELVLTWTPTYSGCPAIEVINADMKAALKAHGIERLRLKLQMSPAWTTDWLTEAGAEKLQRYGIAPPACGNCATREIRAGMASRMPAVACPHCQSMQTHCVSPSGSTRCKALYVCDTCREPFDYFKAY